MLDHDGEVEDLRSALAAEIHDRLVHGLVDPANVTNVRVAPVEPHQPNALRERLADLAHHFQTIGGGVALADRVADRERGARREPLVAVEDQDPVAGGVLERHVARGGEIILPRKLDHARVVGARHILGLVARAGVDHHDLVDGGARGTQTIAEVALLVARDHAERDPRAVALLGVVGSLGFGHRAAAPSESTWTRLRPDCLAR